MAALIAATGLAGCGKPVPPEHAAYVGDWRSQHMRLRITPDGRVEYKRVEGRMSTSVSAPIQRFDGPHFEVGIGPLTTRFNVSAPPHDDGDGGARMTVDGVELVRQ